MKENLPQLFGLVLTGGLSRRMGRDKAEIAYKSLPQWRYLGGLLSNYCHRVYWSCTPEQRKRWKLGAEGLLDGVQGAGPAAGLLRAFKEHPDVAWLVVACDYPNLCEKEIALLVRSRNPDSDATAFKNPEDGLPEPLIAIWEPRAASLLRGEDSPRRALLAANVSLIEARDPLALKNVNSFLEISSLRRETEAAAAANR